MGDTYRLLKATVAIQTTSGKADHIVIPGGATVHVCADPAESSDGLVECTWAGSVVLVRVFDLRERGERVSSGS